MRFLRDTTGGTARGEAGRLVLLGTFMVVITGLHLYTSPDLAPLHVVYKRLYYLPILYAAFSYGIWGGLITAAASGLLLSPMIVLAPGGQGVVVDIAEVAAYLVIGITFGWLREIETTRSRDLERVKQQLEEAYSRLENRAVELISVQEYTHTVLRSIASAVVTVDLDGGIATANAAAERMLGERESALKAADIATVMPDDGGINADVMRVLDGRVPRVVRDVTAVAKPGEIHVQMAITRMQDLNGRTVGAVITLEDVSEVKALTAQLIRADRLAALGELTAGVAHEVRNPLGIIRATMQLFEEHAFDPNRAREVSRVINHEVDRLDSVVKALLDFGRPSNPTFMPLSIDTIVEEVVLFTAKWAARSDVEILATYGQGDKKILADSHQIKQVLVNLISNAVQAMEDTGGTIRISTREADGFVEVEIADDGPGMDAETLAKAFDPFYSTREDGTGLGLTIVHRILDDHDGHIEATSKPGAGSTFKIHLPARMDASSAIGAGKAPRQTSHMTDTGEA